MIRSGRSGLASASASLGRTGRRFAYNPSPLRRPSSPCSGRGASGSVVSHFGPPTAPRSTASAARHASSTSSVSAVPCSSISAADRVLGDVELAERVEQPAPPRRSRGDPVARKDDDAQPSVGRGLAEPPPLNLDRVGVTVFLRLHLGEVAGEP